MEVGEVRVCGDLPRGSSRPTREEFYTWHVAFEYHVDADCHVAIDNNVGCDDTGPRGSDLPLGEVPITLLLRYQATIHRKVWYGCVVQ